MEFYYIINLNYYLKSQFVPHSKHSHLGYKNHNLNAAEGYNRLLF